MQNPQKRRTITPHKKKRIADELLSLWKSCEEGFTGEWDCTGEGKEGFTAMQQGPEALAVMSEYDYDENPDFINDMKKENKDNGDFDAVEIVQIEVDEKAISNILFPASKPIPSKVLPPKIYCSKCASEIDTETCYSKDGEPVCVTCYSGNGEPICITCHSKMESRTKINVLTGIRYEL